MSIRRITHTLGLVVALGGLACDSGNDDPDAAAAKMAKSATADAPEGADEPADAGGDAAEPQVDDSEPIPNPTTDNLDPKVSKAASVAREIEANPGDADAILERHGLDRDGLDKLMYDIARNPDLSRAYRDARTS